MPPKKKSSQRGKGLKEVLQFVKDHKLISSGLAMIPHPAAQIASKAAKMVGLGKKKKKKTRGGSMFGQVQWPMHVADGQKGGSFIGDLGSGLGSVLGGLGGGLGQALGGLGSGIGHVIHGGGRRTLVKAKL
jgi:hypothetical protein